MTSGLRPGIALALLLTFSAIGLSGQAGRDWHVAPNGRPTNAGTRERPIDLASGLDGSRIKPGSTVWLSEGVYRGPFTSTLTGTAASPITVRQYPGERAVVTDERVQAVGATMNIGGAWTIYRDFEVTNLNERRSHQQGFRPMGFEVQAPYTKFVNLTIYDTGMGFGFWKEAVDAELYGNVIFNSGTENTAADARHGHGIYTQNEQGTKLIRDNIVVNQFGFGIHAYPNPGGQVGFRFEGNIVADSGAANPAGSGSRFNNLLVSAYRPYQGDRVELVENFTYLSPRANLAGRFRDANVCLGCADPQTHKAVVVRDNYFAGGAPVAIVSGWQDVTMRGNTFVGLEAMAAVSPPDAAALRRWNWDDNTYIGTGPRVRPDVLFSLNGKPLVRQEWITATGFDRNSTFRLGRPSGTRVFVRPNEYEDGRAHVVVYNWDLADRVTVDLAPVLGPRARYEIHNAMDYLGDPVASGVFDGKPVPLAMRGLRVAPPRGAMGTPSPTPGEFGVFVVRTLTGDAASTARPASRAAPAASEARTADALSRFAGLYVSRTPRGEVRIVIESGQLRAVVLNEPGQPAYGLRQIAPMRFRLEGAPDGYNAEFRVVGGEVRALTLERGTNPSVTLVRP